MPSRLTDFQSMSTSCDNLMETVSPTEVSTTSIALTQGRITTDGHQLGSTATDEISTSSPFVNVKSLVTFFEQKSSSVRDDGQLGNIAADEMSTSSPFVNVQSQVTFFENLSGSVRLSVPQQDMRQMRKKMPSLPRYAAGMHAGFSNSLLNDSGLYSDAMPPVSSCHCTTERAQHRCSNDGSAYCGCSLVDSLSFIPDVTEQPAIAGSQNTVHQKQPIVQQMAHNPRFEATANTEPFKAVTHDYGNTGTHSSAAQAAQQLALADIYLPTCEANIRTDPAQKFGNRKYRQAGETKIKAVNLASRRKTPRIVSRQDVTGLVHVVDSNKYSTSASHQWLEQTGTARPCAIDGGIPPLQNTVRRLPLRQSHDVNGIRDADLSTSAMDKQCDPNVISDIMELVKRAKGLSARTEDLAFRTASVCAAYEYNEKDNYVKTSLNTQSHDPLRGSADNAMNVPDDVTSSSGIRTFATTAKEIYSDMHKACAESYQVTRQAKDMLARNPGSAKALIASIFGSRSGLTNLDSTASKKHCSANDDRQRA